MTLTLGTKKTLTLEVVKTIVAAAEAKAVAEGWNVCIAILDDAGRLLYFQRADNTSNASVEVSIAKAQHAVNYRRPTKFHEDILDNGNMVVLGMPGMLPLDGGLPLYVDGVVIGAIGVSGVQSPQDGEIAAAGAAVLEGIS